MVHRYNLGLLHDYGHIIISAALIVYGILYSYLSYQYYKEYEEDHYE